MLQRLAIDRGAILFDPQSRRHARRAALRPGVLARARCAARAVPAGAARSSSSTTTSAQLGAAALPARRLGGALRARPLPLARRGTHALVPANCACSRRCMRAGLPVPPPVAAPLPDAAALTYRAELITERLAGARSLSRRCLRPGRMDDARWAAIGRCLRRFHDAGVQHADLNARNIMLGEHGEVWVLDFDRGRLRQPGAWSGRVLDRLARSLAKSEAGAGDWQAGFALPAPRARRVRRDVLPLQRPGLPCGARRDPGAAVARPARSELPRAASASASASGPPSPAPTIWIHAVSVGEVQAAQPLIAQLQQAPPAVRDPAHHRHADRRRARAAPVRRPGAPALRAARPAGLGQALLRPRAAEARDDPRDRAVAEPVRRMRAPRRAARARERAHLAALGRQVPAAGARCFARRSRTAS